MKIKIGTRKILIIVITIVLLIAMSIFISIEKFNTPNPISSGTGVMKIIFTQTEIVKIREHPAVFLAKPDSGQQTLIDFMEQEGYHYLEDERMSSTLVFENDVNRRYVEFSVNAYYSKWIFRGNL